MSKINPNAEHIDGYVTIECLKCGKYKEVQRASAHFCCTKCKNAYHAEKRKRAKDIQVALMSLETLIGNMPLRGDSSEYDVMVQMQQMIKNALWEVEQ